MAKLVLMGIMLLFVTLIPFWQIRPARHIILLSIVCGVGYLVWHAYAETQVVAVEEAGSIQRADFTSSFVGQTTTIETEKGTYLVYGVLHAQKGRPVHIEVRKNGIRKLCDSLTQKCLTMVAS